MIVKPNPSIFREYDVRGVAGRDLTLEVVEALGRAVGTFALRRQQSRLVVARDCRLSSPSLRDALVAGMTATGADVLDVGLAPTPVLYFALFHFERPAGVMITGSHNPPDHNGFKICADRTSIHGEDVQELRRLMETGDFESGSGTVTEGDAIGPYREHLKNDVKLARNDLKVVVDAGNGAAGPTAAGVMSDIGLSPTLLYCDPDGTFPNHHPDPTDEPTLDDLKAEVVAQQADIGIAYDGDGDRLGVVCLDGGAPRIIPGDLLLLLFARSVLAKQPGATIIGEVKCSQRLFDDVAKHGGNPVMSRVGHSLIKAELRKTGAPLAGEMSGHIFLADRYFGFDDAIYASARLLELVAADTRSIPEMLADLPPVVNTPELRVECADEVKFDVVARATALLRERHGDARIIDIDGARVIWDEGWGLVRASNTQPVLVLRFEAQDDAGLAKVRGQIEKAVADAKRELGAA